MRQAIGHVQHYCMRKRKSREPETDHFCGGTVTGRREESMASRRRMHRIL